VRIWLIRAAALVIYAISFILPAFQICDNKPWPCGDPAPGWVGAWFASTMTVAIPLEVLQGHRHPSDEWRTGILEAFSGCINPSVLAYLVLCIWPKLVRPRRILTAIAVIGLILTWILFVLASIRPLVGYFLWAMSILLFLVPEVIELAKRNRTEKAIPKSQSVQH
jgi:hypothetical protein